MKVVRNSLLWAVLALPVFGLGFSIGRLSSAHWRLEVVQTPATTPKTNQGVRVARVEDVARLTKRLEKNFAATLSLSPEQLAKIQPVLKAGGEKMAGTPMEWQKRREVLKEIYDQVSPYLTEEQKNEKLAIAEQQAQP